MKIKVEHSGTVLFGLYSMQATNHFLRYDQRLTSDWLLVYLSTTKLMMSSIMDVFKVHVSALVKITSLEKYPCCANIP